MAPGAKTFSYAVSVGRDGTATSSEGGSPIPDEEAWSPEHLVLVGLARCTLASLRFHTDRAGLELAGGAEATGAVTRRESDGRYAFVELAVALDVALDPAPENVRELLSVAERDCFVGASLNVKPAYRWTVNAEEVS